MSRQTIDAFSQFLVHCFLLIIPCTRTPSTAVQQTPAVLIAVVHWRNSSAATNCGVALCNSSIMCLPLQPALKRAIRVHTAAGLLLYFNQKSTARGANARGRVRGAVVCYLYSYLSAAVSRCIGYIFVERVAWQAPFMLRSLHSSSCLPHPFV